MSLFDMYSRGSATARTQATMPTVPTTLANPSVVSGTIPDYTYKLNKARADVKLLRSRVDTMKGKRDLLIEQRAEGEKEKEIAEKNLATFDLVLILLQKTTEYARGQIKGRIEEIVSQALNVVFGGKHKFMIRLDTAAGQPIAEYYLEEGGVITQLKKPDYDRGGGKIDVICMALKLAIGEIEGIEGPLLMDEVGKHVSKEYHPNIAYFLKEYCAKFGRQIILITHNTELGEIGDASIYITQNSKKESVVRGCLE